MLEWSDQRMALNPVHQLVVCGLVLLADAVLPQRTVLDNSWVGIAREFGFPVLLIVFFVWQNYLREGKMAAKLQKMEAFIETTLTNLVVQDNQSRADLAVALNALSNELKARPCVAMQQVEVAIRKIKNEGYQTGRRSQRKPKTAKKIGAKRK